jgi:signal transduction histidine kinase
MAKEKLAHLFDGFRQRDASAMRNQGGTGPGLAITKRYCEVMGGELVVESAPGEGTALTLRLPVERIRSFESGRCPRRTPRAPSRG